MTADELRRGMALAGYDTDRLAALSQDLKIDLFAILAAWAPVLVEIATPPPPTVPVIPEGPKHVIIAPPERRLSWPRRLWRWLTR